MTAKKHPVVLYLLEQGDEGHDQGGRIRIDDLHGDRFWFFSEPDARGFMETHGMVQIDEDEMARLRRSFKDKRS